MEPAVVAIALVAVIALVALVKTIWDAIAERRTTQQIKEVEARAFRAVKTAVEQARQAPGAAGERELRPLEERRSNEVIWEAHFELYNKQIEKYQNATRARATWSFLFAIAAMNAGLAFVLWGGSILVQANEPIVLAAGTIIAAVGGAVSAFLTATFLAVHKLSLTQLNRYFRQPVINDHILRAQRLADECGDAEMRKKLYEKIVDAVTGLIKADVPAD